MHHISKPTITSQSTGDYAKARYFYEAILMVLYETELKLKIWYI